VAEVQDFHDVLIFTDAVVDEDGTVLEFADAGTFFDGAAHVWESSKQLNMVQQRSAETRGSLCVVFGDVADDFGQIA